MIIFVTEQSFAVPQSQGYVLEGRFLNQLAVTIYQLAVTSWQCIQIDEPNHYPVLFNHIQQYSTPNH